MGGQELERKRTYGPRIRIPTIYIIYAFQYYNLITVGRDCLHGHGSFSADRGAEAIKKRDPWTKNT
jgi:hypothetical protein